MKRIYLASPFSSRDTEDQDLRSFRNDLRARGIACGVDVILAEEDPHIDAASNASNLVGVLEGCARLIGASDAFYGAIFERHGTPIELPAHPFDVASRVSFFEAELLEACFQTMPCRIVRAREFEPNLDLMMFLRLTADALGERHSVIDLGDIGADFEEFCGAVVRGDAPGSPWLFDPVSLHRIWPSKQIESVDPRLSFLKSSLRSDMKDEIDGDVVMAALSKVSSESEQLPHIARLSYLWIALRELSRGRATERIGDFGTALEKTLVEWNKSAAWHGLHGSHPMGCLATLNELTYLRQKTGVSSPPFQPRASAYYSVAKRLQAPANARRFLYISLALCRAAEAVQHSDIAAIKQQRGNVLALLAVRGEPWQALYALREFRAAVDLQEKRGVEADYAVALGDYAYALFYIPLQKRAAIGKMREALRIMEQSPTDFYFRAGRKFGEMLAAVGKRGEAIETYAHFAQLARDADAFDQSRQLEDALRSLNSA